MNSIFYKKNPCKSSSLPYYKINRIKVPDNMKIVHNDDFTSEMLLEYSNTRYFKLIHHLEHIGEIDIDQSYKISKASLDEYVNHINSCYEDIEVSLDELSAYKNDYVYDDNLWFVIRNSNDEIIGSIIAHYDSIVKEGILDWVQVSKEYRKQKIGTFMVLKELKEFKNKADFVTVSGKCDNLNNPEILYRKCGFSGNDIWHILTKR